MYEKSKDNTNAFSLINMEAGSKIASTDHHVNNRRAPARGSQLVQAAKIHAGTKDQKEKGKDRRRGLKEAVQQR